MTTQTAHTNDNHVVNTARIVATANCYGNAATTDIIRVASR